MNEVDTTTIEEHDSRVKVAVIGSGLAGLHSAYLLSQTPELRERFEVHVFEANDCLGLDGSSITFDDVRIDVPLRSFNAGESSILLQSRCMHLSDGRPLPSRLLSKSHEAV